MPRPELTPGNGGGKPAKPESNESRSWLPSYIPSITPPPKPKPKPIPPRPMEEMEDLAATGLVTFVPPVPPPLDPAIEEYNQRQQERIGHIIEPPDRGKGDPNDQGSNEEDQSRGKLAVAETIEELTDLAATGLVTLIQIDDTGVDQETYQELITALPRPNDAIEMEFYLAARHNPLLREVMLTTQQEGIPPVLQGKIEGYLRIFADCGMDEEDEDETRRYLLYRMHGGPGHDHDVDPLDAAWTKAHEVYDPAVGDRKNNDKQAIVDYHALIETAYGVTLQRDGDEDSWDLLRLRVIHVGLDMAAAAFGEYMRGNGHYWDDTTAFRRIIGGITINLSSDTSSQGALAKVEGRTITVFWDKERKRNYYPIPDVLLHELGHIFNANAGLGDRDGSASINETEEHPDTWKGMGSPYPATLAPEEKPERSVIFQSRMEEVRPLYEILGFFDVGDKLFSGANLTVDQILLLRQSWAEGDTNEITADGFLNWVFYRNSMGAFGFTNTSKGKEWQTFMNDNMDEWIRHAIAHNALQDERNLPFFIEQGMLPPIVGNGKVVPNTHIRSGPSDDSNIIDTVEEEKDVPIFGYTRDPSEPFSWFAVWLNGGIRWVYGQLIYPDWHDHRPESEDAANFKFSQDSAPLEAYGWIQQLDWS